jgi:hypothetical protein
VELNYQATLLSTREEIAMVLLGPFGNILLFVILVLTSFIIQKVVGAFPEIGSKLVIGYGIQAFLDPFLILLVDLALKVCTPEIWYGSHLNFFTLIREFHQISLIQGE